MSRQMTIRMLSVSALAVALAACSGKAPELEQYGGNPEMPKPHRGLMPDMTIAKPAQWGDTLPTVPKGYRISAIATDLSIPRQTLVLPNGDILVAEGRGGSAPRNSGSTPPSTAAWNGWMTHDRVRTTVEAMVVSW